eukprot:Gregarina_sp_Poly_1__2570@NODE_1699_length_3519_cov_153_114137_g590_i1_p6_GENE_NODE_1699_length_3519_cov_153_114137_g590_i1NODE_1699_length_3519_cov_153_114137_g590_i1_p6_ORF_typecomplete_len104_score6_81DUF3515/PF12028_8/0_16_NODE_1699_length_3519_cov_153_114137_g590_i111501461
MLPAAKSRLEASGVYLLAAKRFRSSGSLFPRLDAKHTPLGAPDMSGFGGTMVPVTCGVTRPLSFAPGKIACALARLKWAMARGVRLGIPTHSTSVFPSWELFR